MIAEDSDSAPVWIAGHFVDYVICKHLFTCQTLVYVYSWTIYFFLRVVIVRPSTPYV